MDFQKRQNEIKAYIQNKLPGILAEAELSDFDNYIDDFFDLDLYQQEKQLFYVFNDYNYDDLSNESEAETMNFSLLVCFQNNERSVSKTNMLKYSSAIYEMFDRSGRNFEGIGDIGKITNVVFYNEAEGNPDVKVAAITFTLISEI